MQPTDGAKSATLLRPLLKTGKRDVPWIVALRNTAAVVLPLVVGELTGLLPVGLAIGTGALVTMFADQPGPYRLRMRRLLLTALAAGAAAFAGATLGHWRAALLVAAALWGFAGALLVAIGPNATRAGLTSMILLVIMGADPQTPLRAAGIAGLIFAGGALQALFAITAWPLHRYRPERLALATAFGGLAAAARQPVAAGDAVALPPSLNDLQALLFGSGRAHGRAVEAFRVLGELAERMRIELLALADLQSAAAEALHAPVQALRLAAAEVLDILATALTAGEAPAADPALDRYRAALEAVERQIGSATAPAVIARGQALGGQLRAAAHNADAASSGGEIRVRSAEFRMPLSLRPGNPFAILRANLRLSSPAFRHALRCSACLVIALLAVSVLPLTRGYWMPMTVVIVLKPDFGATWRYGLLRVAGTLGGLLLTTVALHFAGAGDVWISLALMAALCFAFRELAAVHYGIAVVCLTGLVVILLSFYGIPAETAVDARAVDTALGSALALLAYFVWPTWERGREREALARMLDAYREYLVAVLRRSARARKETRVAARAARSVAQASLDRLAQEPAGHAHLPRAETLVAQANRLVRAAMLLEAVRDDDQGTLDVPALARFTDDCEAALRDGAAAFRERRAPSGDWRLRERQRELADGIAASAAPAAAWAAALRDASDRIVDAIDSVLYVLRQSAASTAVQPVPDRRN